MGGGDSLYDKIDKGIRSCKVVLTCVTSKYVLSANCRREVSLADALKKPVIPLLLEKMTWPPDGPMSMVFTQLLYINFHSPDINIQNTWNCPQLNELIAMLQTHIPQRKGTGATPENPANTTKAMIQNSVKGKGLTKKSTEVERSDHADAAPSVQETTEEETSVVNKNIQRKKEKQENQTVQSQTENTKLDETHVLSDNTRQKEEKQKESMIHDQKLETISPMNAASDEDVPKQKADKSSACHII